MTLSTSNLWIKILLVKAVKQNNKLVPALSFFIRFCTIHTKLWLQVNSLPSEVVMYKLVNPQLNIPQVGYKTTNINIKHE